MVVMKAKVEDIHSHTRQIATNVYVRYSIVGFH